MRQFTVRTIVLCLSAAMAGAAHAGTILVDGVGGGLLMHSRPISGVFNDTSPNFPRDPMLAVHYSLHASGIVTDGYITMLVADTDHGLAFLAMIDDPTIEEFEGLKAHAQVGMTSTAPDTAIEFINDYPQDAITVADMLNGTKVASGHFTWNYLRRGDAFSWANLVLGDTGSFVFSSGGPEHDSFPGLHEEDTFQFVSWNGQNWEIVGQGDFAADDKFVFNFTVVPGPGPLLLGMVAIGLIGSRPRRRRA